MTKATLGPSMRKLLEHLARHEDGLLESQVVDSAGGAESRLPNDAQMAGCVGMGAHPTVKERGSVPAAAVIITDKGRAAL